MARRGRNGPPTCWLCGNPGTPEDPLNYDHIIPKAEGGPHEQWNLIQAHRSGNSNRHHDMTPEDYQFAMTRKAAFEAGHKMPTQLRASSPS